MDLDNRERFVRYMKGMEVDRPPFFQFMGAWPSTIERWKKEGLEEHVTRDNLWERMGFDHFRGYHLRLNSFVYPHFEKKTLKAEGEIICSRTIWGGVEKKKADQEFMPLQIEGPVTDRASWERIRDRLDPATEGRFPPNWKELCREARESGSPVYAGDLPVGFFGGPRELLTLERQSMLFYDDPDLMREILDTLFNLWTELYCKAAEDAKLDYFFLWEDMCYKNGPLISPKTFREFLLPCYRKFTSELKSKGVRLFFLDSDGDMRKLVPLWKEGGIDITFPWETQMGLDIGEVRKQHPRLGMIGGLDKSVLSKGKDAIDRELEKVPPMLKKGRYIPCPDHGVPNDVPWENYSYFCRRLREMVVEGRFA